MDIIEKAINHNRNEILYHNARILFWDIETSSIDIIVRQYDLKARQSYFNWKDVKRDWNILGAAWKFQGDSAVRCISVSSKNPHNDEIVVRTLHEILQSADVLVAHNGDAFDIKKFNARALYYDLPPIMHIHTVDTLKIARKAFFLTSNALGYIASLLKVSDKGESPNWNKVIEGCPIELGKMREYNKLDVEVLEQVYDRLSPWDKSHPNMQAFGKVQDIEGNKVKCCKKCASPNIRHNGKYKTRSGKFTGKQKYICKDCRHIFIDHLGV